MLYHVAPASIGAYTILHLLLRRGHATSVTSLIYLTPLVAALVEWAVYGPPPTATMWLGTGVACVGVAMGLEQPRGAVEDADRRGSS